MALSKIPSAGFQDNVKFRNIIINGSMDIRQRSDTTGFTADAAYRSCDRWITRLNTLGTWDQEQSTDVPSGQGFAKSLKMTVDTADASPAAGDFCWLEQRIEGQYVQYLKKGTSNAVKLTLSFWVRSSKTGTYIAQIQDNDNSRVVSKSYTIDTADTWEKKIISFPADTTGALTNDNNLSLQCKFFLGAGSNLTSGTLATSWESSTLANWSVGQVNLADTANATFYLTGVQLEAGETASDFEFLPTDVNQHRCERYYQTTQAFIGNGSSVGGACAGETTIGTTMRTVPSASLSGNFVITDGYTSDYTQSSTGITLYSNSADSRSFMVILTNFPSLTQAKPYHSRHSNSSVIQFSAEL